MLWVSEHADSSWERAPRCEEAIGARHMTLRHHWRLQLTPEGLSSWHNRANNQSLLDSYVFDVSNIWKIEFSLTFLILEIRSRGHKQNWIYNYIKCTFSYDRVSVLFHWSQVINRRITENRTIYARDWARGDSSNKNRSRRFVIKRTNNNTDAALPRFV